MELAITSNSPPALRDQLDNGASATCPLEIQYSDGRDSGTLSSLHWNSVVHVSPLHVAVANCFRQNNSLLADVGTSRQRSNSVEIVRLLVGHGAAPKAVASFAVCLHAEWKTLWSATCIELALEAKKNLESYLGLGKLDEALELMLAQGNPVVVPRVHVPRGTFEVWQSLLLQGKFSDVHLLCPDGTALPAHKAVLASASSYFESRLFGAWTEGRADRVETTHPRDVMQALLTYMYTGSFDEHVLDAHAGELLSASNEYLLEDFKRLCEAHLVQTICAANVKERMQMAELFQCRALLNECFVFVRRHIGQLFWDPDFRSLEAQNPGLWATMELAARGERVDALEAEPGEPPRQDLWPPDPWLQVLGSSSRQSSASRQS